MKNSEAICAKLERREEVQLFGLAAAALEASGIEVSPLINPDGPEAATIIREMEKRLAELHEVLQLIAELPLGYGGTMAPKMARAALKEG